MTDPFALLFLRRLEKLVYLRRAVCAIWREDNWRRRLFDLAICSTIDDLALLGYEQQARESDGHIRTGEADAKGNARRVQ